MKNKFRRGLESLVVGGTIVIASWIPQNAKGQLNIWGTPVPLPTEPINMFINQESTPQALEYNTLTTQEARNAVQQPKVSYDKASQVQGMDCYKSALLYTLNSKFSDKDLYTSTGLIYGGYDGDDINEISTRGGTTKYFGTEGIPTGEVGIVDIHHMSNYVLTGDKIKEGSSYNFQEVGWPWAAANTQPGGPNTYTPLNADTVLLYYTYLYKTDAHDKNIATIPVVWFKIINGQYEFVATNPNVKIIMEREDDPPVLKVKNSAPDSLIVTATDANLKSITYSVDGGAKKPLTSGVGIKMGLPAGNHTILAEALDYFRLVTDSTFQRTVTGIINYPPNITISSPVNGETYTTDIINLTYNITDKENDPITASYSINSETKVETGQNVNKQLKLTNGLYKILIDYADPTHTLKDSVSFEVNKPDGIEPVTLEDAVTIYPNPTREYINIRHETHTPKTADRKIYDITGKLLDDKKIEINSGETIENINVSNYPIGIYIIIFTNGTKKQRLEFTKE